jgi:cytochrome c oxidase cbb3-type subunit 3
MKTSEDVFLAVLAILLIVATIIVLVIVLNLYIKIDNILSLKTGKQTWSFDHWWKGLTDAVPLDKEDSVMMNHNYDGIRELDNHLPPWWTALFVITVVFSVFYIGIYHFWNASPLQEEEYALEMTTAQQEVEAFQAKNAAKIDENSVKNLVHDTKVVGKGKEIYTGKCAACHGMAGEGGVGPNLTDEFWLHGGTINDVFKTIKNGVPDKGMIAWKATLKPDEIQSVSNYILSIQGSNPANAKTPQGEKTSTAPSDSTKNTAKPVASL